eukprot:6172673-Pleurochrysis_carterae.AAC.1
MRDSHPTGFLAHSIVGGCRRGTWGAAPLSGRGEHWLSDTAPLWSGDRAVRQCGVCVIKRRGYYHHVDLTKQ